MCGTYSFRNVESNHSRELFKKSQKRKEHEQRIRELFARPVDILQDMVR